MLSRQPAAEDWGLTGEEPISVDLLRDLDALSGGFDPDQSPRRLALDFEGLDGLLKQVRVRETPPGLWRRFLEWVRERLERGEQTGLTRFVDWLEDALPPAWVVEMLFRGAFVLLVLMLLLMLARWVRELEPSRWRMPRLTPTARGTPHSAGSANTTMDWQLIGQTPVDRLAAVLMGHVVQALIDRGLLPADRSLTHRELGHTLARRDRRLARLFGGIAVLAEPYIYGGQVPGEPGRDALLRSARAILEPAPSPARR
jgi:hypothetical protein